jgi:WD40 repeat protein
MRRNGLLLRGTTALLAVLAAALLGQGPLLAQEIKPRTILPGHVVAIYGIAFSPDGKTLAAAGTANVITLWDVPVFKPRKK